MDFETPPTGVGVRNPAILVTKSALRFQEPKVIWNAHHFIFLHIPTQMRTIMSASRYFIHQPVYFELISNFQKSEFKNFSKKQIFSRRE